MYMKLHEHEKHTILALCDSELLGKKFKGSGMVLDLDAYAYFYKGKLVSEAEALAALPSADSINLVGKKAIAVGKKAKLFSDSAVLKIGSVPHVQVYKLRD